MKSERKLDLRLVKPIKRYNKFHKQEIMVIGCKVINITDLNTVTGYRFKIDIERCDFKTGELVRDIAYAHYGIYKNWEDRFLDVPYYTNSNVLKKDKGFLLEIYSIENTGVINNLVNLKDYILNNDEKQIMEIFHDYYKELNLWLEESPDSDIIEVI